MIRSSLTIALVPRVKKGPWILWDPIGISIPEAAKQGADGVELFTESADSVDAGQLKELLDRYGIGLAAVGTGAGKVVRGLTLTDPDPEIRERAILFIREMMGFGCLFGAPAIIGSMQGVAAAGTDRDQALGWLAEGLNTLGKFAEEKGVPLILEPLNRYETNLLNTLEEGARLIDTLETKRIFLLADLFHMNIEEASIPDTIRTFGRYIGHVHFADSNRRPVGFGHLNMKEIARALKETGYPGYVSAEAFPWPDPVSAAAKTMESFRKFFRDD